MKKPKPRIKKVFEKVMENNGFNVGKAMREEGYSPKSAKNPLQVTQSKSWEALLDEYLPESLIVKTHKEAFNAKRDGNKPDWQIRMKASELGYKVRGKLVDRGEIEIKSLKGSIVVNEADKS